MHTEATQIIGDRIRKGTHDRQCKTHSKRMVLQRLDYRGYVHLWSSVRGNYGFYTMAKAHAQG